MAEEESYHEMLRRDFGELIESLPLPELEKHALRSRWLDQVTWMEGRADHARNRYYFLRLTAILGGVIIPALVSLNVTGDVLATVRWVTFGISLAVAITSALEEFFHYGDRWRNYRRTVEFLKIEGWLFFQLAGPYEQFSTHKLAHRAFASRVEEMIRQDVQVYISEIVKEREQREEEEDEGEDNGDEPMPGF